MVRALTDWMKTRASRASMGKRSSKGTKDQGELKSDQRPLQGAFLIPPILPVVLIMIFGVTMKPIAASLTKIT